MTRTHCPDCRALVPEVAFPSHRYLGSSPGCWAVYGEVLAREYQDFRHAAVHRLTVDAYSAQHPGKPERVTAQSVCVHLTALCLVLERGLPHDAATGAMQALTTPKRTFPWLEPPKTLGELTILDVHSARNFEEHRSRVHAWAECVWRA